MYLQIDFRASNEQLTIQVSDINDIELNDDQSAVLIAHGGTGEFSKEKKEGSEEGNKEPIDDGREILELRSINAYGLKETLTTIFETASVMNVDPEMTEQITICRDLSNVQEITMESDTDEDTDGPYDGSDTEDEQELQRDTFTIQRRGSEIRVHSDGSVTVNVKSIL